MSEASLYLRFTAGPPLELVGTNFFVSEDSKPKDFEIKDVSWREGAIALSLFFVGYKIWGAKRRDRSADFTMRDEPGLHAVKTLAGHLEAEGWLWELFGYKKIGDNVAVSQNSEVNDWVVTELFKPVFGDNRSGKSKDKSKVITVRVRRRSLDHTRVKIIEDEIEVVDPKKLQLIQAQLLDEWRGIATKKHDRKRTGVPKSRQKAPPDIDSISGSPQPKSIKGHVSEPELGIPRRDILEKDQILSKTEHLHRTAGIIELAANSIPGCSPADTKSCDIPACLHEYLNHLLPYPIIAQADGLSWIYNPSDPLAQKKLSQRIFYWNWVHATPDSLIDLDVFILQGDAGTGKTTQIGLLVHHEHTKGWRKLYQDVAEIPPIALGYWLSQLKHELEGHRSIVIFDNVPSDMLHLVEEARLTAISSGKIKLILASNKTVEVLNPRVGWSKTFCLKVGPVVYEELASLIVLRLGIAKPRDFTKQVNQWHQTFANDLAGFEMAVMANLSSIRRGALSLRDDLVAERVKEICLKTLSPKSRKAFLVFFAAAKLSVELDADCFSIQESRELIKRGVCRESRRGSKGERVVLQPVDEVVIRRLELSNFTDLGYGALLNGIAQKFPLIGLDISIQLAKRGELDGAHVILTALMKSLDLATLVSSRGFPQLVELIAHADFLKAGPESLESLLWRDRLLIMRTLLGEDAVTISRFLKSIRNQFPKLYAAVEEHFSMEGPGCLDLGRIGFSGLLHLMEEADVQASEKIIQSLQAAISKQCIPAKLNSLGIRWRFKDMIALRDYWLSSGKFDLVDQWDAWNQADSNSGAPSQWWYGQNLHKWVDMLEACVDREAYLKSYFEFLTDPKSRPLILKTFRAGTKMEQLSFLRYVFQRTNSGLTEDMVRILSESLRMDHQEVIQALRNSGSIHGGMRILHPSQCVVAYDGPERFV